MVTSYHRGHLIYWNGKVWRYKSDNIPISEEERPCVKCGRMPTYEGYDACLGHIEGARNACCGHGVTKEYIQYEKQDNS